MQIIFRLVHAYLQSAIISAFIFLSIFALSTASFASRAVESSGVTDLQIKDAVTYTQRPFVLINETELNALRMALGKDTWKSELYRRQLGPADSEYSGAGLLAIANRWLKADINIPAYGGHGHHFFCDCGTRLMLPEDGEPKPSYKCPACGKTFSGERYDAAVRCFRHHDLANAAQVLAVVYGIEQNKAYADKAAEILRKYAEAYPGPHTGVTSGGILFQSLNEAMWVIPLARVYDLIYDSGSLTDDDKRFIEEKLFRPIVKGLMKCGTHGNWGSWHFCAVGVVGFAIRDEAMVRYAVENLQSQIRDVLQDDGLWPESVHTYHFFALQAFIYFTETAYRAGIDLYNWEGKPGKSLKSMFTAPLQYMYPSLNLPAINDGWWASPLPLNLYEIAYLRWNDPAFEWTLQSAYKRVRADSKADPNDLGFIGGAPLYRFLFGHTLEPECQAAEDFRSTDFANFGICTLRNGLEPMVTFHYGKFLGHGHLDKMSFTLFANDSLLIPDFGTPGYGSSILHWYQSTAGHNTVVVDGKDQARSKESRLTAFHSGAFTQYAQAEATDIYPGVSQTRSILLLGNVCITRDVLHGDDEHNYDWLVRCQGKPEVAGSYSSADLDTAYYPLVDFERRERFGDGYGLKWKCGKTDLAFGMWTGSGGGRIALGACPGETAMKRASLLICRQRSKDAAFFAAMAPVIPGEDVQMARMGSGLEIKTASGTDFIYIKGMAAGDCAGDLQTDADIAAVRTANGVVTQVVIIGGTQLKWRGETLLQCAVGTGFVEKRF